MPFTIENTKRRRLVKLQQDIIVDHARELWDQFLAVPLGNREVVVDASAVTKIDVAMLQLVIAIGRFARKFTLRKPSAAFTAAITRLGLTEALPHPEKNAPEGAQNLKAD
jgi:anti-anti-sigma regulatory factor